MVSMTIKQLSFVLASALASRNSDEQYLPEELNDALLGLINSVSRAALTAAIVKTQEQIRNGMSVDRLSSTDKLETSERFATDHIPRSAIVSLMVDMSGLEQDISQIILGLLEHEVDKSVFENQTSVEFEGIGVISAGSLQHAYHIELAEGARVPPLRHIAILGGLFREQSASQSNAAAAASEA